MMETKQYTQQIINGLRILPNDKIAKVADFVHFLIKQTPQPRSNLIRQKKSKSTAKRIIQMDKNKDIPS